MNARYLLRRPFAAGVVLALLAILFLAGSSAVHPPAAAAQVFGCTTSQRSNPLFGSLCPAGSYGNCAFGLAFGCLPFSSSYGYSPYSSSPYSSLYGSAYGAPYGCAGSYLCTGLGVCGASLYAPGCNGVGALSCAGLLLQAGQSCANGIVTCSAVSGCGGAGPQLCSPIIASPSCQVAPAIQAGPSVQAGPTIQVSAPAAVPPACAGSGYAPTGQACGPQPSTASASMPPSSSTPAPSPSGAPAASFSGFAAQGSGSQVSLASGWNLVSAPGGTTLSGVSGSLFTFQAGDTAYETLPVSGTLLKAGEGYWLYAPQATQITLGSSVGATVRVSLPAGQPVMIGNPGNTPATVSGADSVQVYNAATSSYAATTQLQPGQGAWALSNNGGQATISNFPSAQP